MDININTKLCDYYLNKDGKIIYIPLNPYKKFLCLINKIKLINIIPFPYLHGKDEYEIINKLEILLYIKKNNFKFLKINLKDDIYEKNTLIYIFNSNIKNVENIVLNLSFFQYLNNNEKMDNYIKKSNSLLNRLTIEFIFLKKIYKKISNEKILIQIFYEYYIKSYEIKSFLEKNNLTLNSFKNYNDLYIFLEKNKFVHKFYNIYSKDIIKNYKKIYDKISLSNECKEYKLEIKKYIENFDDVDLLKIINKYVDNKFNKKIIKNKFIELSKKYNVK